MLRYQMSVVQTQSATTTVGTYNCSCKSGYNVTDPNLPINSSNTCEGKIDILRFEALTVTVCIALIFCHL